MKQLILINENQLLNPTITFSPLAKNEALVRCANCKALSEKLYQQKTCKTCLDAQFDSLRYMIDAVIGNRYSNNISSILPVGLPTDREFFQHDTLELVESVRSLEPTIEIKGATPIIPWLHYNRKRYMSSTYPRKY